MDWSTIFNTGSKILGTAAAAGGAASSAGLFGRPNDINNTTTSTNPWSPGQPYMLDVLQEAQDLYRSGHGSDYYPGEDFVGMGSDTATGYDMIRKRAMDGSPLRDQSKAALSQIIEGQENPYLDRMYDLGANKLSDNIKSLYSKSGRYGSDRMANNAGDTLSTYATKLYGDAYENDANRRMDAIKQADSFAESDYNDAGMLLNVGKGVEGYQEREQAADKAKWEWYQNNPYARLGEYESTVKGITSGAGSTTTGSSSIDYGANSTFGDIGSAASDISDIWGT